MITIFNRREIKITRDLNEMNRVCKELAERGIPYLVRTNSMTNPGRYHGIPQIRAEAAYEYRIYIRGKDYQRYMIK